MDGMGPTTRWKRMNLVYGVSVFLILLGNQPFHTIQESSSDSSMVMGFGLIEYQLGLSMPLRILQDLLHLMMVFTGIHRLQKGRILYSSY